MPGIVISTLDEIKEICSNELSQVGDEVTVFVLDEVKQPEASDLARDMNASLNHHLWLEVVEPPIDDGTFVRARLSA